MNTTTFDINKFKAGTKATTKLGNSARFITMLRDGRMLVEITPRSRIVEYRTIKYAVTTSNPYTDRYYVNGMKYKNTPCEFDLVMNK